MVSAGTLQHPVLDEFFAVLLSVSSHTYDRNCCIASLAGGIRQSFGRTLSGLIAVGCA
jgi:hypothetical protein